MRSDQSAILRAGAFAAAFLALPSISAAQSSDLIISGVIDGPLSGGVPKAVELYVINDISDLSIYGIGSANNGGGSDGEEFGFPAVAATAGDYIYVASESTGFSSFFGFAPDYTSGSASINGDDAIELFQSGVVVDTFGEITYSGAIAWRYTDGWAYRSAGSAPNGGTFAASNWSFSGADALDTETTNAGATTPFPEGSFGGAPPPPPPPPPPATPSSLVISGVVDGPLSGGVPKAVELFVLADIADLSQYGVGSANNGGGSDGQEFTFPAVAASAGDYIYVASEATGFTNFFGFAPNYTSSALAINGDDAVELFLNGDVVDVFGDINVDGTGEPWDHLDGWAYRTGGTGPDGSTFVLGSWSFSGINALDNETTNAGAATPFPIGTFTSGSALIITGVVDGPLTGGVPKAVELYAVRDIADLSAYGVGSANNGGGSDGQEFTFPADSATAGDFIYVASESTGFTGFFGFAPDYTSTALAINGDDAIELFFDTEVVDVFGDINLDGTGEPWDHLDGWAYRNDGTGPDRSTFILSNWSFSGVNALDTETSNATATTPFPIGTYSPTGAPPPPPTAVARKIHEIQGSGDTVTGAGPFEVQGVVTGDFQGPIQLRGFFIQEEDADADADPATSEGIFVFCGDCAVDVHVGDLVTVVGTAQERSDSSEPGALTASELSATEVRVDGAAALPAAITVDLPVPTNTSVDAFFEALEGMLVTFTDRLTVDEYFQLGRFGQLVLSEGGRPRQYGDSSSLPLSAAGFEQFEEELARRRIVLDDDANGNNVALANNIPVFYPLPGFSVTNFVRGGDTIQGLTGVLQSAFNAWRVRPVIPQFSYTFRRDNPRPQYPASVGGTLKVASFNVLNFFQTLDTGPGGCSPNGSLDCRGANTMSELVGQTTKIVEALCAIDADIVGLVEIENDNTDSQQALIDALRHRGCGHYGLVATGPTGTDAIKVAFIYKTGTVRAVANPAVQGGANFTDPNNTGRQRNRPAVAQTFEEIASGVKVTVVNNHLKSKGSSCGAGDDAPEIGAGSCNLTRKLAAEAQVAWLATNPTGVHTPNVMIIGDLNAYRQEDPIVAYEDGGYVDLIDRFNGVSAYSFVFDGKLGYLDYAMANEALLTQVTGITEWHINADEVNLLDYNDEIRDPGEESFEAKPGALPLFAGDAFRSSDHDPLVVGLCLRKPYVVNTNGGKNTFSVDCKGRFFVEGDDVDGVKPVTPALLASLWGAKILSNGRITVDRPLGVFQIRAQLNSIARVAGRKVNGRYRWRFANYFKALSFAKFLREINSDGWLDELLQP